MISGSGATVRVLGFVIQGLRLPRYKLQGVFDTETWGDSTSVLWSGQHLGFFLQQIPFGGEQLRTRCKKGS